MRKSRFTEEKIIAVLADQKRGMTTAEACRKHGISSATFYKWKAKFGGMDVSEARKLKTLETENAGRPRGKPSGLRNHLDSTQRRIVPRSVGKLRAYWLAGKFRQIDLIWRERLQQIFLFSCRKRVDPLIEWHTQLAREPIAVHASSGRNVMQSRS